MAIKRKSDSEAVIPDLIRDPENVKKNVIPATRGELAESKAGIQIKKTWNHPEPSEGTPVEQSDYKISLPPPHDLFFYGSIGALGGIFLGTVNSIITPIALGIGTIVLWALGAISRKARSKVVLLSAVMLIAAIAASYSALRGGESKDSRFEPPPFLESIRSHSLLALQTIPGDRGALLGGILIGERASFSPDLGDAMRVSGTTHIVALSGYNIMIVSSFIMGIFGFFLPRKIAFYFATAAIILFVVMTGASASLVRAALMGIVLLLAFQTERLHHPRNAIIFAALCMAIASPRILAFDIGFQLSFAALLGITYIRPLLDTVVHEQKMKWIEWIRNQFLTTLSAQLAVLPLLLFHFGQFSFLSIFTNLLILWTLPILMLLGFCLIVLAPILPFVAALIASFASLLLGYDLGIIAWFGGLSLASFDVKGFSFLPALFSTMILALFLTHLNNKKKRLYVPFREDDSTIPNEPNLSSSDLIRGSRT